MDEVLVYLENIDQAHVIQSRNQVCHTMYTFVGIGIAVISLGLHIYQLWV